jgi:ABC-type polysaccharide/polyol phosphate transport system ATPase subunit
MNQFKAEGKTTVFVSDALDDMKELCQRSSLLGKSRIATIANTETVINDYLAVLRGGINRASFGRTP